MTQQVLIWSLKKFAELTVFELYAIMHLRSEIFVVEQNCVYLDADNKDQKAWHLCAWENNLLVAYCRILPAGVSYHEASIGRVVTHAAHRKTGLGKMLMQKAITHTYDLFNTASIRIGAQQHLEKFYGDLGFTVVSEPYMEDGIPHQLMLHQR